MLSRATLGGALLVMVSAIVPASVVGATSVRSPAVRLRLGGVGARVPARFLGLSVEPQELAEYAGTPAFDHVIRMLEPKRSGLLLRVAGQTTDFAWWQSARARPPKGVIVLDDAWTRTLAALVRRDRLRVMLAVNVAVHSPRLARDLIAATRRVLPQGSLAGIEVGNEPDLYFEEPALERQRLPSSLRGIRSGWTRAYGPLDYRRDYAAYAQTLTRAFPGVPLSAPDITSADLRWISPVLSLGPVTPGVLSVHRYPLTTCWPRGSPHYPTIPMLLAPRAASGLADTVRLAVAYAHSTHVRFAVTEMNAVSCGGNHGVADSFAAALWAPDALFAMLAAGVDNVDWHLRPHYPNSPFRLSRGVIRPLPELVGLAVFSEVIRNASTLLRTQLSRSYGGRLVAWAVRHTDRRRTVLLINKTSRAATVIVPAGRGPAAIRRLLGPSRQAMYGVTFAGRSIGPLGRWNGTARFSETAARAGVYRVLVPGYSALTLDYAY